MTQGMRILLHGAGHANSAAWPRASHVKATAFSMQGSKSRCGSATRFANHYGMSMVGLSAWHIIPSNPSAAMWTSVLHTPARRAGDQQDWASTLSMSGPRQLMQPSSVIEGHRHETGR